MAIDVWRWHLQVDSSGDTDLKARVRTVEMGDGIDQVASDGINPVRATHNLVWKGIPSDVADIKKFLTEHYVRAFVFTPPAHEKGLYRVVPDSVKLTYISSRVHGIQATLTQAFGITEVQP